MKGLDRIASIRRRGFRPPCVTMWKYRPCQVDDETWIYWEARDIPELIDLRPLIGLFVTVMADGEEGARWAKAAMKAGASTVISIGAGYERVGAKYVPISIDYRINGQDIAQ